MSIHIGAEPGQIASTVLLPGDPMRAKFIAETMLEGAVCFNEVRGMLGFTKSAGRREHRTGTAGTAVLLTCVGFSF
jgi:purine-nucleoside phosphorylase